MQLAVLTDSHFDTAHPGAQHGTASGLCEQEQSKMMTTEQMLRVRIARLTDLLRKMEQAAEFAALLHDTVDLEELVEGASQ